MLKDQIYTLENALANNRARLKQLDSQIEALAAARAHINNQQTQFQEILVKLKAEEIRTDARTEALQEKYAEKLNEKLGKL